MIKNVTFALLLVGAWSTPEAGEESSCIIPAGEREQLIKLDFDAFDQTMGEGWRKYSARKCYREAGALIDDYYAAHKDGLESWQKRINRWHAGQLYAMLNDYETARQRFLDSYNPDEPADPPFPWNDYVAATIAFLDGDRQTLQKHRDRIAASAGQQNLQVVDNLLKYFGQPYSVAYSGGSSN